MLITWFINIFNNNNNNEYIYIADLYKNSAALYNALCIEYFGITTQLLKIKWELF